MDSSLKYQLLEVIIRIFCGIVFMFQGYDKLFNVKINRVVELFRSNSSQSRIPGFIQYAVAFITSNVEFLGGVLLVVGLFKNLVLVFMGFDIILVAIAFSIMEPVWDMRHVFPRLIMVSLLLLMPDDWNRFSLDFMLSK